MPQFKPFPGYSDGYAYSCQTWLARQVNAFLHPGTFYCWFARRFNAYSNGDDSNPLMLYFVIDRAVNQDGVNNAKIKDIRANLLFAIKREMMKPGKSPEETAAAMTAVLNAPLEQFTPQLWRIYYLRVKDRCTQGSYPDEYNVVDLSPDEFDVVIE